jgi:hypothetical protein
MVLLYHSHNF